jgi:hypothetical protein
MYLPPQFQPQPKPSPASPDRRLHIQGMQGLGDNIYQRAFIRILARTREITLETSWPEFYADLPVRFVRPTGGYSRLRTQNKNIERSRVAWVPRPPRAQTVRNTYQRAFLAGRSIINGMEESFGIGFAPPLDLPPLPLPRAIRTDKPLAFVRPLTVRSEWFNSARNPEPQYILDIVEALRPTHHIVCVADVAHAAEWFVGVPPKGDSEFIHGELPVMDMLALFAASDIIIGGMGFIIPAALALNKDCFVVLGGQGGHNAPSRVLDPRLDCSRIGFATPKDFCQCTNMRHTCTKAIPDLMQQFRRFLESRCVTRLPSGICNGFPSLASAISL